MSFLPAVRALDDQHRSCLHKYPTGPPCECVRSCVTDIPQRRRRQLHADDWKHKSFDDGRKWARANLEKEPGRSIKYFFRNTQNKRVLVCRVFWLQTLGYSKFSRIANRCMAAIPKGATMPEPTTRGINTPVSSIVDR